MELVLGDFTKDRGGGRRMRGWLVGHASVTEHDSFPRHLESKVGGVVIISPILGIELVILAEHWQK